MILDQLKKEIEQEDQKRLEKKRQEELEEFKLKSKKSPQMLSKPSTSVAPTKPATSKNFTQQQLKQLKQHSDTGNYSVMLDEDFVQTVPQQKSQQNKKTISNKVKGSHTDHHHLKELQLMFSKIVPPSQVDQKAHRKQTAPVQYNNFIKERSNFKKSTTLMDVQDGFPKRQNQTPIPQSLKFSQAQEFADQFREYTQSFSRIFNNRESMYNRSSVEGFSALIHTPAPGNQYSILYRGGVGQENSLMEGDITLKDNLELNTATSAEQRGARLIQMINHQSQVFLKRGVMRKKCIELPGAEIRICGQNMYIRTPILFKGNPGTVIEVESSIIIDIDSSFFEGKSAATEEIKEGDDVEDGSVFPKNTQVSIAFTQFQLKPLVQFSECIIKFDRETGSYQSPLSSDQHVTQSIEIGARNGQHHDFENKAFISLFQISSGSKLIIRDCQLKSQAYQNFINSSNLGIGDVCDVAFSLDGSNNSSQKSKMSTAVSLHPLKKNNSSELSIVSCTLEGFSHFIKGGEDAQIFIELSALRGSRLSAIQLINPLKVTILRTIIEKSTGSGLSIKSSVRDKQNLGASSISQQHFLSTIIGQQILKREITIDGAIIMGNMGHGVSIQGDQQMFQLLKSETIKKSQDIGSNLSKPSRQEANQNTFSPIFTKIQIRKTRIYHCKKDGIMLKNLNLSQDGKIVLDSNQLQNNKDNNIWIEKINSLPRREGSSDQVVKRQREESSNNILAFVLHSRIYDAQIGFGVYINNVNCQIQDSEILGNTAGGVYISSPPIFNNQQEKFNIKRHCKILQSTIKSNKDNGILSLDYFGRLDIARCQISDNLKNGIMSAQKLEFLFSMLSNESNNNLANNHQSSNSLLSLKGNNNKSTDAVTLQTQQQQISSPPPSSRNPRDILKFVKLSKAQIHIEICDISYNTKNGISMHNVRLFLKQSRIQNNGSNAISFNESNKFLLKILDTKGFAGSQLQQKKLIQGRIGGSWGSPPHPFKTVQQFQSQEDQEESKLYYNNKIINQMSSASSSNNVFDDKSVRKGGNRLDKRNKIQIGEGGGKRQKSGCCFPASNKNVEKKSQSQFKSSEKSLFTTQEKLE